MSDYILEEIQLNILKYLPVKTLLRFRCVCKWWKQVIDSQSFIQDHLATKRKTYLIAEYAAAEYLVVDPLELMSFSILPSPIPKKPHLFGTHHGIICLYDAYESEFLIWNPWIHKLIRVGPLEFVFEWYDDEEELPIGPNCGFWIDPSTKEFKIVIFQLFDDGQANYDYELYSSTRGDHRKFPVEFKSGFYYTTETATAVVMNNVGHWTVYYKYIDDKEQGMVGVAVLPFDFLQEKFLEPIAAISIKREWSKPVLCNRNGALSLVYMDPDNSFNVYLRREEEWVHVYDFYLSPEVERVVWGKVKAEWKDNYRRVLAAVSGGLPTLDIDEMLFCTRLMIEHKDLKNVVIADDFVESFLLPPDPGIVSGGKMFLGNF